MINISVIMPVFNGEKFLKEAIDSILDQTLKNFEFIIVNDGSTDRSLDIIKTYNKESRIHVINLERNVGLVNALNIGIRNAKGKYIARMDSDDVSLPERFKMQFDYLENNPEVFLIGSNIVEIDEDGEIVQEVFLPQTHTEIKKRLQKRNCLSHPTIMFRNVGEIFYREKMLHVEDFDLYLRFITEGKILGNLKQRLLQYRRHSKSISYTKSKEGKFFAKKALEFYNQRLKNKTDAYDNFDEKSIKIHSILDQVSPEIKAAFKVNDFKKVKSLCLSHFSQNGVLNSTLVYYIATFFGAQNIQRARRIVWRIF